MNNEHSTKRNVPITKPLECSPHAMYNNNNSFAIYERCYRKPLSALAIVLVIVVAVCWISPRWGSTHNLPTLITSDFHVAVVLDENTNDEECPSVCRCQATAQSTHMATGDLVTFGVSNLIKVENRIFAQIVVTPACESYNMDKTGKCKIPKICKANKTYYIIWTYFTCSKKKMYKKYSKLMRGIKGRPSYGSHFDEFENEIIIFFFMLKYYRLRFMETCYVVMLEINVAMKWIIIIIAVFNVPKWIYRFAYV